MIDVLGFKRGLQLHRLHGDHQANRLIELANGEWQQGRRFSHDP
jgi:hypothetical protein